LTILLIDGIKLRPNIVRKAWVRAASCDKRLGEWLEEAIEEKGKTKPSPLALQKLEELEKRSK